MTNRVLYKSDHLPFPDLAYPYDALVPHMDEETLKIQHGEHLRSYTSKLNKVLPGTPYEGRSIEYLLTNIGPGDRVLRYNGGGYFNHRLFLEGLSPYPQRIPEGHLKTAILRSFGSFENFQKQFSAELSCNLRLGWIWLVIDEYDELAITSTRNQDNPLMQFSPVRGWPLIGIDVWEHAYYLNYRNKRESYVQAFWKVLDWEIVQKRYEEL